MSMGAGNLNDLMVRCQQGDEEACNIIRQNPQLMQAIQQRGFANGGEVGASLIPMEGSDGRMSTEPMEESLTLSAAESVVATMGEALSPEESEQVREAFVTYPILERVTTSLQPTTPDGPISGPGTETSDSIDAKLSDGEFVISAKAVKQIGVDKLRKMMEKAEQDYGEGLASQASQAEFSCGGLISKR